MHSMMARKLMWGIGVCFTSLCALSVSSSVEAVAAKQVKPEGPYASPTPKFRFATTLQEQEAQLRSNPLLQRFAKSREALASDPYRPLYHFVSPESRLNDPNGLIYWQGRWHLFYQAYPPDEFPDEKDTSKRRQHWGHAVSDDLIHWRDLPYAIYPGIERMVFSGSTVAEEDRVIAFYPGIDVPGRFRASFPDLTMGQMVAVSRDPLLLNWEKSGPVGTDSGDSDIWKEGDVFFGLIGGAEKYYTDASVPAPSHSFRDRLYGHAVWPRNSLWTSKDLTTWERAGELLLEHTPLTDRYDDGSCPNFEPIGDKHILLYFSHTYGGKYLLGDYDEHTHRFRPYDSGRFNHGQVWPAGVHAPSASSDGRGAVINILNVNEGRATAGWDQIMSLPQRLTLGDDQRLRIEPVPSVTSLRGAHHGIVQMGLPADQEIVLPIQGNSMELKLDLDPGQANRVELNVLRSPRAEERTSITFYNLQATPFGRYLDGRINEEIVLDGSRSSILRDVWARSPEKASVQRGDEGLRLRIFIDRSLVEVFVNDRQYLAMRVYPGRQDSLGVSLRADGHDAMLKSLDAWQLKPIWPVADAQH
jgi:beta-fructofuranosidase